MKKFILASVCTSNMMINIRSYNTYMDASNAMENEINSIPSEDITDLGIYEDSAYVLTHHYEYSWCIKEITD